VNNTLIGSITNTSGVGSYSITAFGLSIYDTGFNPGIPYNGYIDDLRIYNSAIPFHLLNAPQNYRSVALAGTGQYALASAASGWVLGSADSMKVGEGSDVCGDGVGLYQSFLPRY